MGMHYEKVRKHNRRGRIIEESGYINCAESPGRELAILKMARHTNGSTHADQDHPA